MIATLPHRRSHRAALRSIFCSFLAVIAAIAVVSAPARAAPGDFDGSFGAGLGKVLLPMGAANDFGQGITMLPGGQFILQGACAALSPSTDHSYCLAKFNADGSLDLTFGNNGKVFGNFSAINRLDTTGGARRAVLQSNGKIVLVRSCSNLAQTVFEMCLVRHHADGSLDTSFGTNGYSIFSVGGAFLLPRDVEQQADGKFVVAIQCESTTIIFVYFCAARFEADGASDTSYGDGGLKLTQITADSFITSLAIDKAGRAMVAGVCKEAPNASPRRACVVRHLPNGQRDTTFGTQGVASYLMAGNNPGIESVIALPDGRTVLGGQCRASGVLPNEMCILRFMPDGSVDNSIGAAGLLFTSGAVNGSRIVAMKRLPNGQYLMGGPCYTISNNLVTDFCVMRAHDDGTLDSSFGTAGKRIFPIGNGNDGIGFIAYTHDGKILVGGSCDGASNREFCVAKLEGGPYPEQRCSADIDGDGRFIATVDGLIAQRVMNGVTGTAALGGVSFPAGATRTSWPAIRGFLISQCGMAIAP